MSIIDNIRQAWQRLWATGRIPSAESRATIVDRWHPSQDPESMNAWLSASSAPGATVTPATAITNTAVLACVRVLSESVASLPLKLYRRTSDGGGGGKEVASDHPLYSVLHDIANSEMTSFDLREVQMVHLNLWGNFYSEIEMNGRADVLGLWPLRPDRTWPVRHADGSLWYHTWLPGGEEVALPRYRIFHVHGLSSNGYVGMSPVALARNAIGLALATEEFGGRFFSNGARPGGILEHPGKLSPPAYDRLKKSWEERHSGLSNAHRLAILEEGMKWHDVGMPMDDAQFLETRKFQTSEIARIYRVPPHMIQDLDKATFSNIEHQAIEFVVHSLRPWLVRIEQRILFDLIGPLERKALFAEFLVDGLLRGDIQSRYAAYAIGRQWGWLSRNDVRAFENMNPIPEGDDYLVPLNMTVLGTGTGTGTGSAESQPQPQPQTDAQRARARESRALATLVHDAARRIEARCGDRNEARHGVWVEDVLRPIVQALVGAERMNGQVADLAQFWFETPDADADELAERVYAVCKVL